MTPDHSDDVVFITGGAGFLGINLVRFLLPRVRAIVSYDLAEFDYPERDRVRAIRGDIRDVPSLEAALAGATIVVHCAAALPSYADAEIMSTEVDGTRNVLAAARAHGITRVVHISSTAIYGRNVQGTTEDGRVEIFGAYAEAKVLAERECAAFRARGLCVPILRPKTFIGPERLGIWAILFDWAHSGCGFPMIGPGTNRYQLLDVDDLCDAIWATMTLPAATVDEVFNVGAKSFGTMREDFQAVLDRAGHGKRVRSLPAGPIIAVLKLLERLRLSPVYEWVYETAAADSYVSIARAEQRLGFRPRYSNVQALLRNYDWYVAHLQDIQRASGVSHRAAWNQGLVRVGKLFF
ncbi:MAG: NAD-dependent epimerase/dehydratase family protein [Acidobacteria bacterium]|nr:NAD-dependent epimerase/dehydratase family protein [Acidobacteriota bacterium]